MLATLRIKNLALIEDLTWNLGSGFNTLTGETGAGKSILIDGLMLLAGERAEKSMIRTGASACTVEAELSLSGSLAGKIQAILEEIGAEPCEDSKLLLKRTLQASGSNKQFVNGSPVTLLGLKELGDLLVDLHGPHDHQSLLAVEKQLMILDAFGKLEGLREEVSELYEQCAALEKQRESLQLTEREKAEKNDRLTRQEKEIRESKLIPDEDVQLDRDFKLANNARQLVEYASAVTNLIQDGEVSILTMMAQVERQLNAWQKIDPEITDLAELSHSATRSLQELGSSVRDYVERIDLDAARLKELENRLDLLNGLKRKYGPSLAKVMEHGLNCLAELNSIQSTETTLQELEKKWVECQSVMKKKAEELSIRRRQIATPLASKIETDLKELGFGKARFNIACTQIATPFRSGIDHVEFIFAPNPGEAPQPLREIASSGEMARVMLAIKSTLAEVDEVPVLVFDEVDANVGGETAFRVGQKLRTLGKSHQVLCITHQPQVAAQGEVHFSVRKEVFDDRTSTKLYELDAKSRAREIARMLGGESKESLALAQKMIDGKTSK